MIVYICSPYSGDVAKNKKIASEMCYQAARAGHIPVAPHLLLTDYLDDNDPTQRAAGTMAGITLLKRCDEMWVYPDHGISKGMAMELEIAKKERVPIIYRGLGVRPCT